jgi:hypothetical protein
MTDSASRKNGLPGRPPVRAESIALASGLRVELIFRGKYFEGLGAIEAGGVLLRGPSRPMFVEIRTPEGVEFFDFVLENKEQSDQGVTLDFSMKARSSGLQDWMVHAVRNLRVTRDWAEPEWIPRARLRMQLRPLEQTFRGRTFRGFDYSCEYESEDYPIYRLLERSSWAPGGSIAGNSFWLRNSFAPSIRAFSGAEDFYSSEWYLGSIANPNIFQFQPFQTNLESFTMLASERGQLLTLAPRLSHLRSFFEKPRGAAEILHWHEHCGDLASRFSTSPIQVLWNGDHATRTDLINLHDTVRNHVSDGLHRQANLRRERVTTYGVIEEWSRPNLDDYADRILPKLLEIGVRCVFLPSQFQNNLNVWNVGNMCCTVDYKISGAVEEEKLRRFCARAKAAGAEVQMWGNTALSTLDFILRPSAKDVRGRIHFLPEEDSVFEMIAQSADPYIRNPSGALEADHYTPNFMALNLRDPVVCRYWHHRWREARERIGLGGIFLDSSFNLSSDKFHFIYNPPGESRGATADQTHLLGQSRPEKAPAKSILSMYFAHLELVREMQGYGYHYSGEDVGVFGLRRAGPGIEKRLNDLFLWGDGYAEFNRRAVLDAGRDPDEIFFQGMAYRLIWSLVWNFDREVVSFRMNGGDSEDDPTAWHLGLVRAFNEVGPRMLNRTVLEEGRGVIYGQEDSRILWAFADFELELPPGTGVREILGVRLSKVTRLRAEKYHIYEISGEIDPLL